MKKCILILCLVGLLCGCSNGSNSDVPQNNVNDETSNTETTKAIDNPVNLSLNEKITIGDFLELEFTSAKWMDKILPSNTSSSYSYIDDNSEETYFVLDGKAKNISGHDVDVEYDLGLFRFVFNDKYQYSGTMTAESSEHDDFYGHNITPLTETRVVLYVSVPNEVKDIYEKSQLDLLIGDGENDVYDEEDVKFYYMMNFSK